MPTTTLPENSDGEYEANERASALLDELIDRLNVGKEDKREVMFCLWSGITGLLVSDGWTADVLAEELRERAKFQLQLEAEDELAEAPCQGVA
jgi:hypothetical protein